jgi:tetratricopeptide (TPR) repeat protein
VDPVAARELIERERARLRECGADAFGAVGWAALADVLRREGRLEAAEVVARNALATAPESAQATLALALALLEQGRIAEARDELARGLEGTPELREAFERVQSWAAVAAISSVDAGPTDEAEAAEIVDAIDPLADVEAALYESVPDEAASDAPDAALFAAGAPFATATMARLLESQGLVEDAQALRDRLAGPMHGPDAAGEVSELDALDVRAAWRARVLSTLERWLENLRKDVA